MRGSGGVPGGGKMRVRMRDLKRVNSILTHIIGVHSTSGKFFARGISSEGYHGGYRAAIQDVMVASNGTMPAQWEQWFHEYPGEKV